MAGGCRTALIYTDRYHDYRFGEEHPFNPLRLRLTVELIAACGLLDGRHRIEPPRPATEAEVATVHSPRFIEAVRAAGAGELDPEAALSFGLGTEDVPIFPGMHEAALLVVGGSLRAAELVMEGAVDHAFNIGGGLHHASRGLAAGFCVYNDIAVVCRWLVERHGARVLYIDNDAHHGDGVQEIFYDTDRVLTLSFHETGRYLFPGGGDLHERGQGAGYGYSVNVPLDAFTDDASWLAGFEELVPAIVAAYRPDVIVMQNGCDGHMLDPLTHLHATTRTMERAAATVHRLAHEYCGGRLIALGGGGYEIWRVVPRAWALVWAALGGQTAPDEVPRAWRERWAARSPEELPRRMRDHP
ncbi:MAG: acetoin utilization protein AcuC, partial [Chloroflexota bacterium]|nr:acetoin utilization protein AcuC [Chloroflexota bacterium]